MVELTQVQIDQIQNEPKEQITPVIEHYLDLINARPDSAEVWAVINEICKRKRPN